MDNLTKVSVAKLILATLWVKKSANTDTIRNFKYLKKINNSSTTFRTSLHRLLKTNLIRKGEYGLYKLSRKSGNWALASFIEAEIFDYKARDEKWDGGWRIVIFDIPEEKKKYRTQLKKVLHKIGFKNIQSNVWVYPYAVPEFLKHILLEENIKPHTRFITSDNIQDDSDLRKMFNL